MHYFVLHKPYGVLSQFTKEAPGQLTLSDLYSFPKEVYPVGRLDRDSEGLLIITDDKNLTTKLLHPKQRHPRIYWAQVEGMPTEQAILQLRNGVAIKVENKSYLTLPAKVSLMVNQPDIIERDPPIRFRKSIPTQWLELELMEGKNRQVRKMCAAVGFPVLRLLRVSIENLQLVKFEPGRVVPYAQQQIYKALRML